MKIKEIKEAVKNNLDSQVQSLLSQSIDEAKTFIVKKISEEVKEISELNAKYKEIVVNHTDIQLKEAEQISSSSKKLSLISEASVLEKLEIYERVQKNSDQLSLQLTKISINNSAGLYCTIRAEQSQYILNKLGENLENCISNHKPPLKDPENEKDTMVLLFKTWQKTIDKTIDKVKENYVSLLILNKQITAKKHLNQKDLSTMEIPKEYLFIKAMDLTATQDMDEPVINKIKNLREDKTDSSLKLK